MKFLLHICLVELATLPLHMILLIVMFVHSYWSAANTHAALLHELALHSFYDVHKNLLYVSFSTKVLHSTKEHKEA